MTIQSCYQHLFTFLGSTSKKAARKMLMKLTPDDISHEMLVKLTVGISNSDGNWTGLMGMLQRKEIDFSLMGNTMIPQRTQVSRHKMK